MDFGCAECFGAETEDAGVVMPRCLQKAAVLRTLTLGWPTEVVHLRQCESCGQDYVVVYLEEINWEGSHDAEYDTLVPITRAEAASLADSRILRADIEDLSPRRWLYHERQVDRQSETYQWFKGAVTLPETR
ncbi:hypothetical protein LWC34_08570 [Kibdelosporangium philippinense]|uniref:Uncharacterized protein n=1 Tax=Kibdelosporangium philippinense TaxID=211113 RepID=A0ABS8Z4N1_9PSEU|nr:hypothetical protein [Kibdelosporangium philippinense]MCE7002884.1 hypothetical protein [Kibdelosporangium philippinense]